MKKIFAVLSLFIFLLVSCSTPRINTKSLSLEEQRAYYRNLVENPPADIENYKFSDYDIKMILEAKKYIQTKLALQQLEAKREGYTSKKENWIPPAKNNPVKHYTLSEEDKKEIERSLEKSRQENQKRLENLDKEIMLYKEWLEENK